MAPNLRNAIPLFRNLQSYDARWLNQDLLSGISIAAVQIPSAVAIAQLAGLAPVVGLYASVLPLIAYALLGSSRQLVVGPDSTTASMIAAFIVPLAAGHPERYGEIAVALATVAGIACLLGGLLRLGFITDFLSQPILVGFMNGVALNIIASQLGKLSGIHLVTTKFWLLLSEFAQKLYQVNPTTLILGGSLLLLLFLLRVVSPKIPGAPVAVVLGALAVATLKLDHFGVARIGLVQGGFRLPSLPNFNWDEWEDIISSALGIGLVSFCNLGLAGRSFARRGGYTVDENQDLLALGVANLCSAASGGFIVSSSNSQTAIGILVGAKSQIANLVAAALIGVVLMIGTGPLALVPVTALGAILIFSATRLLDIVSLKKFFQASRTELLLSIVATVGVLSIGTLKGIIVSVVLAIIRILAQVSRPNDAILGKVPGLDGYNDTLRHPDSELVPGLLIYRFDSPILFFNSDYFQVRVQRALSQAPGPIRCLLLDMETTGIIDTTGADALAEIRAQLKEHHIDMKLARVRSQVTHLLERTGIISDFGESNLFPSIRTGVESFKADESGRVDESLRP